MGQRSNFKNVLIFAQPFGLTSQSFFTLSFFTMSKQHQETDPHFPPASSLHDPEPDEQGDHITFAEMEAASRSRGGGSAKAYVLPPIASSVNIDILAFVQEKLIQHGLLEPEMEGAKDREFKPANKLSGKYDIATDIALREFFKITGVDYDGTAINGSHIEQLENPDAQKFPPIQFDDAPGDNTGTLLAKRMLRFMRDKGYWIARSPAMYNIVYMEGTDGEGRLNSDAPNQWNDRRFVIKIEENGKPLLEVNDEATTEPGKYYTEVKLLNARGAARVAFGQYKAWQMGLHHGKQPALVQRGLLRVHRDGNKNYERDSADFIDIGAEFWINQRTTSENAVHQFVGKHSAGCLVGRDYQLHMDFLEVLKRDIRFQNDIAYMFITTLLPGKEVMGQIA